MGVGWEGRLMVLVVEQLIVRESGAWYTYEGDQLGQGKENARNFLRSNPDLANEIEKKIKEKLGVGARLDADAPGPGPGPGGPRGGAGAGGSASAGGGSAARGRKVVAGGGDTSGKR